MTGWLRPEARRAVVDSQQPLGKQVVQLFHHAMHVDKIKSEIGKVYSVFRNRQSDLVRFFLMHLISFQFDDRYNIDRLVV